MGGFIIALIIGPALVVAAIVGAIIYTKDVEPGFQKYLDKLVEEANKKYQEESKDEK